MNQKPLVFGHRGASGYRPENTLEAFELALSQGADGVECDLVPTKDQSLIIRHENWLDGSTNISSVSEFSSRKRTGYSDGLTETGWFSEDFDLAELQKVKAIERIPLERPGSAKFDGEFAIPTIDQLLELPSLDGKTLVIEVKHGSFFTKQGINVANILSESLAKSNWESRGISLVFETFDLKMLSRIRESCGEIGKYVFLTEKERVPEPAKFSAYLDEIASKAHGLSVDIFMIFPDAYQDESGIHLGSPGDMVAEARKRGLSLYSWTVRAEDAPASVEEYFAQFVMAGLDGLFVDQPDLMRQVVDGLA